jgi:RNA polymerase sigma factor (sigma-70 family)
MDSCNFPRTVEEMLEAGWYNKLLKKVSKANLKDILNTPEELVQDIFLQIMRSDYLSRYDPEYRPFDVYIYAVADNLIRKRGAREGTNGGKKIVNHITIRDALAEDGAPEPNTLYLDTLDMPDCQEDAADKMYMDDLIESTRKSLQEFKTRSKVEYDGELLKKDPATVFEYILAGKSVSDIAEIMQVSKQYIYVLIHRIRTVDAMQEFYQNAMEKNLVPNKG